MARSERELRLRSSLVDLLSGMSGGLAVVTVGQPMDTIKVKMQTFGHLYSGVMQCVKRTWATEGIRKGFYAGTTPALVAYVSENSVLFTALGQTQQAVVWLTGRRAVEELSLAEQAAAGSLASLFSGLVLCPTELIKCRLQAARELGVRGGGVLSTVKEILVSEGGAGLFRGLIPTWCREIPGYFCFFLGYETSRTVLANLRGRGKEELGPVEIMFCGGVAGLCFWTCIFPLDVIKSRIQVRGETGGLVKVGRQTVAREGLGALYRGISPALIRTFPANAALFTAYEWTKKTLSTTLLD